MDAKQKAVIASTQKTPPKSSPLATGPARNDQTSPNPDDAVMTNRLGQSEELSELGAHFFGNHSYF